MMASIFHNFVLPIHKQLVLGRTNGSRQTIFQLNSAPHCGEKIEISVVDKIDVSDKYEELTKQRDELWERCQRTDSKKKESELREQVGKLDKQIDSFYWLDEWKGEYYYGSI